MEDTTRCVDADNGELHVVQQLWYSPREHDGFYLSQPKACSSGMADLGDR
jgi:hypothetical protein